MKELRKTAILDTAQTLRNVQTFTLGKRGLHAAQVVTTSIHPRHVVCFRYVIVNTL